MANSAKVLEAIDKSLVALTPARRELLSNKANTIAERVITCLKDYNGVKDVKAAVHGSFTLSTIVNPFSSSDSYDIDLGIHIGQQADLKVKPETYLEKVRSHLAEKIDKVETREYCVRAEYYSNDSTPAHHVDVSLYSSYNGTKYVATKNHGWKESDPLAFVDWFNEEAAEKKHLRVIVRLLKWWAQSYWTEMPSGLVLSILTANGYSHNDRLDLALHGTVTAVSKNFSANVECLRPTVPKNEDLLNNAPESFKELISNRFIKLGTDIDNAINADIGSTITMWNRIFDGEIPSNLVSLLNEGLIAQSKTLVVSVGGAIASSTTHDGKAVPPTRFFGRR